jgi:uncharacterized protein YecE (DUF72 family)
MERAPGAPRAKPSPVRILAGTSGWSYTPWRGSFYPAGLPPARMLAAYAARLPTVEVNATAYRSPRPELLAGWRVQVGPGFTFAVKAPQLVTHRLRLRGAQAPLARFLAATAELGGALGPLLFQLPPSLPRDVALLRDFLALLPRAARTVFQLPPAWLGAEAVQALADAGAALCLVDAEEGTTPLAPTAPFGYLRLRRPEYGDAELAAWVARISAGPWAEAFVYFKHEDGARGPRLARRLLELAGAPDTSARP